jgi:hypothetical protein
MPLHLLPEPKELRFVKGLYVLNAETLILLPEAAGDRAFSAASALQAEIEGAAGLSLPVIRVPTPPPLLNVILLVCGEAEAAAFAVAPVETGAPPAVASQAYALTIQRGRIVLYAAAPGGLARGVRTLCQIVQSQGAALPTLDIRDWPPPG